MRKDRFFSQIGQRLNVKTSFSPVFLLFLYIIMSMLSEKSARGPIDIFGWLALSFLLASLLLFASQMLLGLYHLLTGKGGNQGTITDLNLPDGLHKKTSFLPIVMIAIGLFIMTVQMFNNSPVSRVLWTDKILFYTPLVLMSAGVVLLVWNFLFGVYSLVRDVIERRARKDD